LWIGCRGEGAERARERDVLCLLFHHLVFRPADLLHACRGEWMDGVFGCVWVMYYRPGCAWLSAWMDGRLDVCVSGPCTAAPSDSEGKAPRTHTHTLSLTLSPTVCVCVSLCYLLAMRGLSSPMNVFVYTYFVRLREKEWWHGGTAGWLAVFSLGWCLRCLCLVCECMCACVCVWKSLLMCLLGTQHSTAQHTVILDKGCTHYPQTQRPTDTQRYTDTQRAVPPCISFLPFLFCRPRCVFLLSAAAPAAAGGGAAQLISSVYTVRSLLSACPYGWMDGC